MNKDPEATAEEVKMADTAVGERLKYNDYTTIDWLHDLVGTLAMYDVLSALRKDDKATIPVPADIERPCRLLGRESHQAKIKNRVKLPLMNIKENETQNKP